MRTRTRRRTWLTFLISFTVLGALFATVALALGSLAPSQSASIQGALQPQEIPEVEVSTSSARGFFCNEDGQLPDSIVTANGTYPLIDVYDRFDTPTIDLRAYTQPNTWVILTNGCQPITESISFVQVSRNDTFEGTFNPLWSVPSDQDLNVTWFQSFTDTGAVQLRGTPAFDYDPTSHASVPTVAFLINATGETTQPREIVINTLSADSSVSRIALLLPTSSIEN